MSEAKHTPAPHGNGYQELKDIHSLSQEAVALFDKGEYPDRALIARIREIAGCFPKLGSDNAYIGYARWRHRGDNQESYLSICSSDSDGAFRIYRHPARDCNSHDALVEAAQKLLAAMDRQNGRFCIAVTMQRNVLRKLLAVKDNKERAGDL